jgi:hypothetical protein
MIDPCSLFSCFTHCRYADADCHTTLAFVAFL